MRNGIDPTKLKQFIEDAGFDTRFYSGRAMYGKTCLAFTIGRGESEMSATAQVMREAADAVTEDDDMLVDDAADAFMSARSDSMGLGTVIYFPDIEWTGDESEPEQDGEEDGDE